MNFEKQREAVVTARVAPHPGRDVVVHDGRDEMNLVEFPLSGISDRFLDGRKTVVFTEQIWDRQRGERVTRELSISGTDRYGLPTARDEDVLLACVQLSSRQEFRSADVHFSRYELLKLLRWPDESKYYNRLATSLRRWKGVTIYSSRAFYDHRRQSWVDRDFGVFDNLYLYEREVADRSKASASSWFVWNEVLFASFQAGYVKRLDWDLYCRLSDPVAKRLYRLLDKRFYHGDEAVFDLHDLAVRKIRVSERYNTAQMKRAISDGIRELEELWELRPLPIERRFVKRDRGKWEVVFQRRSFQQLKAAAAKAESQAIDLEAELTRREIGPAMASDLVQLRPQETVRTMIELFDWYASRGQQKGPGFLVDSIRNPAKYRLPRGFESSAQRSARKPASNSRSRRPRQSASSEPSQAELEEKSRQAAFLAFWHGLSAAAQTEFESVAVQAAAPVKRDGYRRLHDDGGPAFEHYRQAILRDHFERSRRVAGSEQS